MDAPLSAAEMYENLMRATIESLVRVGRQALPPTLKTDESSVVGMLLAAVATMIATARHPPPSTFRALRDLPVDGEVARWADDAHAPLDAADARDRR